MQCPKLKRVSGLFVIAVVLAISVAGLVQYNVFRGQADLGGPPQKLLFKQDGEDLLVTTTIEIADAPHVLWTHAELVMDHDPYLEGPRRAPRLDWVELSYDVIQCRDDPILMHMRHRKKRVKVVWRLNGHRKVDVKCRVVKQFRPSADELSELAPKLKELAEETRNRAPLHVP